MNKYNIKFFVGTFVFAAVLTVFMLSGNSVNAEYDEYGNYYEPYYDEYEEPYYEENTEEIYDDYYSENMQDETDGYGNQDEPAGSSESNESIEMSVDSSEMTSEDWSAIQESLNSTFHMKPSKLASVNDDNDAFKEIKQNSSSENDNTNDTWVYLMFGIIFITVGASVIVAVICTSVRTKHKMKERAARYARKNNMEDILSDENIKKRKREK